MIDKKPRVGQGRAGIKRKVKLALPSKTQKKREDIIGPKVPSGKPITGGGEAAQVVSPVLPTSPPKILGSELPSYILPGRRPPPKPPDQLIKRREEKEVRTDVEENSPFQESIISEIYERPDKSYFQEPTELKDLINTNNVIQQFLPKQTDIDKIL